MSAIKAGRLASITRSGMRQVIHKLVGVLFWLLMALMWAIVVHQHKAGVANIRFSVQYISIVIGAVLSVTLFWIRHNVNIYRRKGQRQGRPENAPRIDEDSLGRPLTWTVRGGHYQARRARHLVVDVEDGRKVYRRP